jgi:hypothetical protein
MPMTSLADLLDPDQWMTSGKNLTDFPWPNGNNEREAMKLILSNRPLLNAHLERWSKRMMEALGRRGGDKVGDVFVEEYLRELWERSRRISYLILPNIDSTAFARRGSRANQFNCPTSGMASRSLRLR